MTIHINHIPYSEFTFKVSRSRGAGGQSVNRTNSAVQLLWSPETSLSITEEQRKTFLSKLKLTSEGFLSVECDRHKSQDLNKKECIQKFYLILQKALFKPKKRIATKPTKNSQKNRLKEKSVRSEVKKLRSSKIKVDHD